MKHYKEYIVNVMPSLAYGIICGSLTGLVIFFFKFAAGKLEEVSRELYALASEKPLYIIIVFAVLVLFAFVMAFMHKSIPEMTGGGIPRCEGILRGILPFRRRRTFFGTIIGSFISFFSGLPVGSEGPAVLIGTAIGGMCSDVADRRTAWSRYVMSGGAGAGFAVATGAPLSAILFVLEEIHKRFTPMLVMTVSTTVLSATYVNNLLCRQFGISPHMISQVHFADFRLENVGYLVLLGLIVAIAVAVFDASLGYFGKFMKKMKKHIPSFAKLLVVFILTGIMGLFFADGIYSGHEIIENILSYGESLSLLFAVFVIRMIMMVLVTDSGATGGIFIPTLAIGAVVGAIAGRFLVFAGMPTEIFPSVVMLGMCAFMGGTLRAPLTASVIFIEVTCRFTDFFYVVLVIFLVNFITAMIDQTPFYDRVLENLEENHHKGKTARMMSFTMKVSKDAFVIGKTVRDVMWPSSSVVVSITRADNSVQDTDHNGEKKLFEGDTVVIRAKTYDEQEIIKSLRGLVGEQYPIEEVT